jgi:hypothetical protein
MAESHYSADSAPLPRCSLTSGMPDDGNENPSKVASFPSSLTAVTASLPTPYLLHARILVGMAADSGRRLTDCGTVSGPALNSTFPTTTFID